MSLRDILNEVIDARQVLVTGPHRSGTTIGAAIIAAEIGFQFITEDIFKGSLAPKVVLEYQLEHMHTVLQAPSCFRFIEGLQSRRVFTVMMFRERKDITASQVAIEKASLGRESFERPKRVYDRWHDLVKRDRIENPVELRYDDLREHWMFEEDRKGWGLRQIAPTEGYAHVG